MMLSCPFFLCLFSFTFFLCSSFFFGGFSLFFFCGGVGGCGEEWLLEDLGSENFHFNYLDHVVSNWLLSTRKFTRYCNWNIVSLVQVYSNGCGLVLVCQSYKSEFGYLLSIWAEVSVIFLIFCVWVSCNASCMQPICI